MDVAKRTQFVVTLDSRRDFRSYELPKRAIAIENTADAVNRKQNLSPMGAGKPVNKIIIQNDTEDEEELRKEIESSASNAGKTKRKSIAFDEITSNEKRPRREDSHDKSPNPTKEKDEGANDEFNEKRKSCEKIRTNKTSGGKYENLPSREYFNC